MGTAPRLEIVVVGLFFVVGRCSLLVGCLVGWSVGRLLYLLSFFLGDFSWLDHARNAKTL